MSEQEVRGTLARGGTFRASPEGIEIFDPAGQMIASFGREVISGASRDGQVVTLERHNDTIVTITAASIAEAADLEQFIGDQLAAPAGVGIYETPEPEPEPEAPIPPYTPEEAPPQPEPELTGPEPPTPAPSMAEQQIPGGPGYDVAPARGGGSNRWLLWGCLGCGGLIVLALIIAGIGLAFWIAAESDEDAESGDNRLPTAVMASSPTPPETGAVEPPLSGEQIDGTLPPGGGIDGEIAFDVPQSVGPYIVHFVGIFGEEAGVWIVEPGS